MIDKMKDWCEVAKAKLNAASTADWARTFVDLRMEFHRLFSKGLLCSTAHGVEFFDNVLNHLSGARPWTSKDESGEYGDNFRKIVEGRK